MSIPALSNSEIVSLLKGSITKQLPIMGTDVLFILHEFLDEYAFENAVAV